MSRAAYHRLTDRAPRPQPRNLLHPLRARERGGFRHFFESRGLDYMDHRERSARRRAATLPQEDES